MALSPLPAPPQDSTNRVADDPVAAEFGQKLFFEMRMGGDQAFSCASCHKAEMEFTDQLQVSETFLGRTTRNAPTVWNTAHNRWQFWDGRADSHWMQALGPVENPVEMGSSRAEIAQMMWTQPDLRAEYENVFGVLPDLSDTSRFPHKARPVPDEPEHAHNVAWEMMTAEDQDTVNRVFSNVGKAIAAYERRLIRKSAPFDTYVEGLRDGDPAKLDAISESAKRGAALFVGKANCNLCHSGPNFSDGEFHNIGIAQPPNPAVPRTDNGRFGGVPQLKDSPFNALGPYSDDTNGPGADRLRFLKTIQFEQEGSFKTPSLRNVAQTFPFMHAGQFQTLHEVVSFYSRLDQQPPVGHRGEELVLLDLSPGEINDLVAFLESLTGEEFDESLLQPLP